MSKPEEAILTNWSVEVTGPVTRSIDELSTSGWIAPNAAHWSIEAFLPIETRTLIDYLNHRSVASNELDEDQMHSFSKAVDTITQTVGARCADDDAQFAARYHPVDPDSICRIPETIQTERASDENEALLELCDRILVDAAYKKLTQDDIEKCVGVSSQWGVPLTVDFDLFSQLVVYTRGDIIGKRCKRRLSNFYRMEMVDVAIYQRLVVLFQLSVDHEQGEILNAEHLHLRIFKNIPKQDVDMLLPGTKVRLSKFDRAKVIVPSLGGWLLSLQKISRFVLVTLALAAYYSTALVVGLVLAAAAYLVKSFFSYFQTKNRYLLDLTRNLYFQKLDSNSGAASQLIQQAGRQCSGEAILAYYAILSEGEAISPRRLRRKCERLVREAINVEIDFRTERAMELLLEIGLIRHTTDAKVEIA